MFCSCAHAPTPVVRRSNGQITAECLGREQDATELRKYQAQEAREAEEKKKMRGLLTCYHGTSLTAAVSIQNSGWVKGPLLI